MSAQLNAYLNFRNNAREAMEFYRGFSVELWRSTPSGRRTRPPTRPRTTS